ncbi:MAG: PEPxxWA-CTERM sorting domain-containing protein [Sphingomonadaceae bacterium]
MRNLFVMAFASLVVAAPAAATIPLNVAVGAGARAVVGTNEVAFADQFSAPWSGPGSLAISQVAMAGAGSYNVTAAVSVKAVWLSGEAGTVAIDWGRSLAGTPPSPPVNIFAGTNNAPPIDGFPVNWFYEFTATGNGFFQGTYAITATGGTFGLNPIFLTEFGSLTLLGGSTINPSGSGSFAIPLLAGQTYRIAMFNFGNVSGTSGASLSGSASAQIAWEITGGGVIPEPGTWALLIAGFGLVGVAARRRRLSAA